MSRTPGPWKVEDRNDPTLVGTAYPIADQVSRGDFPLAINMPLAPFALGALAALVPRGSEEAAAFIVLACNAHERLVEALRELVMVNEQWNQSVREIVNDPNRPLFADKYLDKARAVLAEMGEG